MITLKKLSSLKDRTRIRKVAHLCREYSRAAARGEAIDLDYIRGMVSLPELLASLSIPTGERLQTASGRISSLGQQDVVVLLDDLYYLLLDEIGAPVADWDFVDEGGALDGSVRRQYPVRVYLDRLRSPFNVGSVFRTADSFGVERIFVGEGTSTPEHPRAIRTARGCLDTVPWEPMAPGDLSFSDSDPIFALELGGTPIETFPFPARGTVIIGSEELGVSPEMLSLADRSLGRVTIPLAGTKGSLNVSVAFGILMQHWFTALDVD